MPNPKTRAVKHTQGFKKPAAHGILESSQDPVCALDPGGGTNKQSDITLSQHSKK